METNESYREDCWLDEGEDYWPFYKLEESFYLSFFKSTNIIYQDEEIYHYMIIGEEVVDVLAGRDPLVYLIEEKKELINEFSEVYGDYVDKIKGQTRLGYSNSDIEEFYELEEIINHHGHYLGSVIRFHDFETGQVYIPFELKKNVGYGNPVYLDNNYYFLQADFNKGEINLYEYYPDLLLQKVETFKIKDLNLYNLSIMGKDLHLISQGDRLDIYYPYRKTVKLESNESVLFIEDEKIYIGAWVEEGWDEKNHIAGPEYEYYEKLVIKDMEGKVILEKRGDLFQNIDGSWWLS